MQDIDAATAMMWVKSGEAVLVDVREPSEFAALHAVGALPVPLGQLSPEALLPGEKRKLVLICASGMRSARGCSVMRPQGYAAYSLKGGLAAWQRAGGAVESAPGAAEAAARQGKVMAGGAVVLGLALSALVHPGFLILTAFAGARLFNLLRPAPEGGCASKAPGQTSCAAPGQKGGGCGHCGARDQG